MKYDTDLHFDLGLPSALLFLEVLWLCLHHLAILVLLVFLEPQEDLVVLYHQMAQVFRVHQGDREVQRVQAVQGYLFLLLSLPVLVDHEGQVLLVHQVFPKIKRTIQRRTSLEYFKTAYYDYVF